MTSKLLLAAVLAAASPITSAMGDAASGKSQYEARCGGCHSVEENRIGPAHRGVFGRKAGARAGFGYSNALKASTVVWDEATLDAWLADPEKLIPGQAMYFQISDARERENIVAFLKTLKP
jgi:cytochrome c